MGLGPAGNGGPPPPPIPPPPPSGSADLGDVRGQPQGYGGNYPTGIGLPPNLLTAPIPPTPAPAVQVGGGLGCIYRKWA